MEAIRPEDRSRKGNGGGHAEDGVVQEEGFLRLFALHFVNASVGPRKGSDEKLVDVFALPGGGWVLGGGHPPVVTEQMLVGEVHVKVLGHVHCSQNLVEQPRLVENFMGNSELYSIEIGENEEQSSQIHGAPKRELELTEIDHDFEEKEPVDEDCNVEAYLKEDVVSLEFSPLFF